MPNVLTVNSALPPAPPIPPPPPPVGLKWNPGFYMSSGIFTQLGNLDGQGNPAGSEKAAEIAIVRSGPAKILGWEGYYMWRALWNSGAFDGSTSGGGLDADYVAITGYVSGSGSGAVYNSPRRMGIYMLHTDYFSDNPAARCVPDFILNNSAYGPGPVPPPAGVSTYYGWGTTTGQGGAGTGSVMAWWRTGSGSVMAAYGTFFQQMASHVLPDGYTVANSPYIEYVKLMLESVDIPENTSGAYYDSTYSTSNEASAYEGLISTVSAAFPTTIVVMPFNYLQEGATASALAAALPTYGNVGTGGPDVFGYSSGQNIPTSGGLAGFTFGQALHYGLKPPSSGNIFLENWPSGGTDYRLVVPEVATVQNTEFVTGDGTAYTIPDIIAQCNALLATHVAIQYQAGVSPTGANWLGTATSITQWMTAPGTWGGSLDAIYNATLTNSTYPTSFTT